MEVEYLKIIGKYTIVLMITMFLRAAMVGNVSSDYNYSVFSGVNYKEIIVQKEEYSYMKPEFNKDEINRIIDNYIDENSCMTFEYNVFRIGNDKINIFINCGAPKNVIYDYKKEKQVAINEIVNDINLFQENVSHLLNLKYPTFVTEEVNIWNGTYNIKDNEIIGYYSTTNYGNISIKINNNEIANLMKYDMQYDQGYENEVYTLDANKKTVSFTFDDGPSDYDLDIIDYLVYSHSKATFFLVGNRINNFSGSIEKMLANDMEIGNHTFAHRYLNKLTVEKAVSEIQKTNEIYYSLTQKNMMLLRPPYGSIKQTQLNASGYPSILWSLDTLDWKSRDADKVYEEIMSNVKDGDIILMHSLYESTRDAVKKVIPELYKQGYQIVTVSELFQLKGKTIEPGKSYVACR